MLKHIDQQESTKRVDDMQNKLYRDYLEKREKQIHNSLDIVLGMRKSRRIDPIKLILLSFILLFGISYLISLVY